MNAEKNQPSSGSGLLLGIDVGTSSLKVILADIEGTIIAEESEKYPVRRPRPGWAEQDPEQWYAALIKTIHRLKESIAGRIPSSGISPGGLSEVKGIGVTGQMITMVALDSRGRPIRPAIMWMEHDRIRAERKALISLVESGTRGKLLETRARGLYEIFSSHFQKEGKILFPSAKIGRAHV